jgi:hypothetical protein
MRCHEVWDGQSMDGLMDGWEGTKGCVNEAGWSGCAILRRSGGEGGRRGGAIESLGGSSFFPIYF